MGRDLARFENLDFCLFRAVIGGWIGRNGIQNDAGEIMAMIFGSAAICTSHTLDSASWKITKKSTTCFKMHFKWLIVVMIINQTLYNRVCCMQIPKCPHSA